MDDESKNYSANALNNARWLKRAVEQRNSTTLKISAEIIRQQTEFLEKGLDYLKPLSLRDVALAVGMHESTVSRVTTGLLILTPRGGMPLKSFFSVNIRPERHRAMLRRRLFAIWLSVLSAKKLQVSH